MEHINVWSKLILTENTNTIKKDTDTIWW